MSYQQAGKACVFLFCRVFPEGLSVDGMRHKHCPD